MREGLAAVRAALKRAGFRHVEAHEWRDSVVLTGRTASWERYIEAGYAATGKGYKGVVNDVEVPGATPAAMEMPSDSDTSLEGNSFDVIVIGGGVIGASIARELTRWDISVALLEKEDDLAVQTSSRNDGMVHPAFAVTPGSKKAHYNLRGNGLFSETARELGVRLNWPGSLVLFSSTLQWALIPFIRQRIRENGVKGAEFWSRSRVRENEPNITSGQWGAIFLPEAGIVSPYLLTVAFGENAVENGAQVFLGTAVTGMNVEAGRITEVKTNRGTIRAGVVVNAAGVWADRVAGLAGDRFFTIHGRKGTAAILDKKAGATQRHILASPEFTHQKHTKGGGLVPTVDGNLLVGPTAVEVPHREDFSTSAGDMESIFTHHLGLNARLKRSDVIAYFSGVRACTFEEDFVIEPSGYIQNLIHAAGIQSPGLASTPAIAKDVAEMAVERLRAVRDVRLNARFDPFRKTPPHMRDLTLEERAEAIRRNPAYGRIICRCECVSEGEVQDALRSPVPARSLDGVKRRVRAGMGRCQGGFCTPLLLEIIAREQGVPLNAVSKCGKGSEIALTSTRPGAGPAENAPERRNESHAG